jgi:20S proteasome alpha/beta subunit
MAPFLLSWLFLSFMFTIVFSSSSPEAPWQSNSARTNVLDEAIFGNQPVTVFAPGGRLYFLERTVAAASSIEDPSSNLVVALSCRDGIVLVTTSCTSPHLDMLSTASDEKDKEKEEESTTSLWITSTKEKGHYRAPFSRLSPNAWMVTGGNAVDSGMLRLKITQMSESLQEQYDGGQPLPSTPVSCAALARRVANHLQQPTQSIGKAGRILAVRMRVSRSRYGV